MCQRGRGGHPAAPDIQHARTVNVRGFPGFLQVLRGGTVGLMTTYLVEAYVTRLDEARTRELASAVRSAALAMSESGATVRYLGSIFVPGDETCFHLLDASSADIVREAGRRGGFAVERIVEVIDARGSGHPESKEAGVAQYMVERHLPGFPPEQLPAAAAAAKAKSAEVSQEGPTVRYVRSTWVPESEKLYCLFEGSSQDAVADVQARANLPYDRIHAAAFLTAEDV